MGSRLNMVILVLAVVAVGAFVLNLNEWLFRLSLLAVMVLVVYRLVFQGDQAGVQAKRLEEEAKKRVEK